MSEDRRTSRRTPPDCPPEPPVEPGCPVTLPDPYRRITDPCGNEVPVDPCSIDPSKFVTPAAATPPPGTGAPQLPFVEVLNELYTAVCEGTAEGTPVTVTAGTLTEQVPLARVSDLTQTQATYLDNLDQVTLNGWVALSASALAIQARLSTAQAQELRDLLDTAMASVAAQAEALARSTLDCVYWNLSSHIATCPLDGQGVTADIPTSTVGVHVVSSRISQLDAENQAQTLAESRLHCEWSNTAMTVTCPGNDVPNDVTPPAGAPTTRLRVGSVVVGLGVVRSTISRADANALAQVQAAAQLACFYYNTEQIFTCPADVALVPAITGTSNPVTIPANAVTSDVNQADADAQALILAQVQGICEYGSDALTVACAADAAVGSSPLAAAPVELAANEFRSPISKADANNLRDIYAASISNCFWTNDEQVAQCVDFANALPPGQAVVAAGAVVSYVSKAEANALAMTLAEAQRVCLYANDTTTGGACAPSLVELQTGEVAAGTVISPASKAAANALAQILADALNVCVNPEEVGGGGGGGLPPGGTAGQVLTKQSADNGDADWEEPRGRVFYQSMSPVGTIPTGAEIDAALAAPAYGDDGPRNHDLVIIGVASVAKFAFTIRINGVVETGLFVRVFTIGITDYGAVGWQLGLY